MGARSRLEERMMCPVTWKVPRMPSQQRSMRQQRLLPARQAAQMAGSRASERRLKQMLLWAHKVNTADFILLWSLVTCVAADVVGQLWWKEIL